MATSNNSTVAGSQTTPKYNINSEENQLMIKNLNLIAARDSSLNALMRTVALGQASMQQIDVFKEYIKRAKAMGPPPHDDSVWEEVFRTPVWGSAINNELQSSQESKPSSSENKKDKDSVDQKLKKKLVRQHNPMTRKNYQRKLLQKMKKKQKRRKDNPKIWNQQRKKN